LLISPTECRRIADGPRLSNGKLQKLTETSKRRK
jgi:hypothetical protein